MTIELVTGHAGSAHVSSADVGQFNAGTVGTGKYVLNTGTKFACNVQSANAATIGTGDAIFEGRHVRVSSTESVSIDNGAQGMKRNDIICIKYDKNGSDVESASLAIVKGTATSGTPSDPAIPSGSILNGSSTAYMPLWRLPINGITVGTPVKLYGDALVTLDDAGSGSVAASRLTGTIAEARIPDLGGTYLKREPSGTSELPQNSTSTAYPIVLSNTFANNGEISYMTVSNFKNAIGITGYWTQLTAMTGTTAKTIDTSGYEEIMVVMQHFTDNSLTTADYVASIVIPKIALTSHAKTFYLSGGYNGSSTNGRSAAINITTTKATPQHVKVNATDVTADATWQIYAR